MSKVKKIAKRFKVSKRKAKRLFKKTAAKRLAVNDAFSARGGISL